MLATIIELEAKLTAERLELHSEQTRRQEMEEKLRAAGIGEFFPSHHQDTVARLEEELELVQFMKDETDADLMEQREINKELQSTIESLQADLKTRPNSGRNLAATQTHIVFFTPDPATTRSNLAITEPNLVWLEPDNVEPRKVENLEQELKSVTESKGREESCKKRLLEELKETNLILARTELEIEDLKCKLAILESGGFWWPSPAHAESESDTESISSTDSLDDAFPSRTDKLDNVISTRSIAVGTGANETDHVVHQTISSSTQTCSLTCQTCSTQTSTIKCKTISSSTQTSTIKHQTTTSSTQTNLNPKRLRQVLSVVTPTSHDETRVALELFGRDEPRPSSGLTLPPPNAEPLHVPPAGPDRSYKLATHVPAGLSYMDSFKVMGGRTTFTVISDRELAVVQYPP